jgi:uncharacterized protein YaaN involved in tellurite resistance
MSTDTKAEVVEAEVVEENTSTEIQLSDQNKEMVTEFISQIRDSHTDEELSTRDIISVVGSEEVEKLGTISDVLKSERIGHIQNLEGENSDVSTNLMSLRTEVEKINPQGVSFDHPNWLMGMVYKMIGGTPAQKYLTKFETTEDVINGITANLNGGKLMLKEDNASFSIDKKRYIAAARSLEEKVKVLMYADTQIETAAANETDEYEKQFLENEVLFAIRQHIQDLQQMQAVSQQGVMALDILIKNNNELVTSVARAVNTTMPLVTIGLNIARGLANQKRVLETVNATNQMAGDMLVNNAKMMKEQGADIQKGAVSAAIEVHKIQEAMSTTLDAIKDVEEFKSNALPDMKKAILELNEANTVASAKISQLEMGEVFKKSAKLIEE